MNTTTAKLANGDTVRVEILAQEEDDARRTPRRRDHTRSVAVAPRPPKPQTVKRPRARAPVDPLEQLALDVLRSFLR